MKKMEEVPVNKKLSRRRVLKCAAYCSLPMLNLGSFKMFAQSDQRYSVRTLDLVGDSLVIDMLSGLDGRQLLKSFYEGADPYDISDQQAGRIVESGINVFHPAHALVGYDTYDQALELFGNINNLVADNQNFVRVDSIADLHRIQPGKNVGIIPGLQSSSHFRVSDDVNRFYQLGQRVSQLTYNTQNFIGSGSTDRRDGGISEFGVEIVERMNQLGMAIDVSHCGDQTTLDAFDVSKRPVLITHSNSRSLVPGHPRCKTDEAIKKMARGGGVMGITAVRNFVSNSEPTTVNNFLDHIDHVVGLVGIEHVGIGTDSDIDGYDALPEQYLSKLKAAYKGNYAFRDKIDIEGLDHPKKVFDIVQGLVQRKYSDSEIRLVVGGNFTRALGNVWGS